MTKDEAITLASRFIEQHGLEVLGLEEAHFVTFPVVNDETSIPRDIVETYRSVKSKFKEHWVVRFKIPTPPNTVVTPGTEMITVYENGDVKRM